ncbi:ceramide kinase isoform X2 [Nematostella vectensis]|uniref:ceramide kinase isoform X2 n=1 Tax=Nematostella vectensis TaxID=45351 RepID=UPI00139000F1|nr:ceramide kinase isoform X2 [Nematostella vectensis]
MADDGGTGCILNSILYQHKRPFNVCLTRKTLYWSSESKEETKPKNLPPSHSIPIEEIIAVVPNKEEPVKSECGDIELLPYSSTLFTIYAIKRLKHHKWREKKITFDCKDVALCREWIKAMQAILNVGGKKQAAKIYRDKIQPLFELAGIQAEVIVTQRANHAKDYLEEEALEKVDGVICVGGDGMFHEILNGLIIRTQQDYDVDTTNPDFQAVCPKISIGVIPAGSTDAIAYCTTGINDPVTSALHIIIGDIHPLDVCSVSNGQEVLRYSVSMMAYGFFGDVLQDSEKFRWMGPKRYDCSGFKKFMGNRGYEGTIKFLSDDSSVASPQDRSRCRTGCFVCNETKDIQLLQDTAVGEVSQKPLQADGSQWRSVKGKFISVIGANMSCACAKSPEGLSPSAHLADGCLDLILVKHTSRVQYLRHMLRLAGTSDHFNFNFVEVFRVREFQFTPFHNDDPPEGHTDATVHYPNASESQANAIEDHTDEGGQHDKTNECQVLAVRDGKTRGRSTKSIWNVDGEIVSHAPIIVRVHRQLVRIFARGIEECENTPSCRVCRRS